MSKTFGENPRLEGEMVDEINRQLEEMCPLDKLEERRQWRDKCLLKLSQLKKKL